MFDIYFSLYLNWQHVPKSMTVLSIITSSVSNFYHYIINSAKLPLYNESYDSLIYSPFVHSGNHFSDLSFKNLTNMSHSTVKAAVSDILSEYFPNFIAVYTDGSLSPLWAGYAFYIPELHVSFTNNLPLSSSSFITECYAIIEALILISNFAPNNYIISFDSMSCLLALSFNSFNSRLSPLDLRIRTSLFLYIF